MAMAGTTVREYGAYAPQEEEVVAHAMSLDSALGLEGGLRLVPQAGEGKGRGLLASKAFEQGFVVFKDDPIAALQQNKDECWACERCLRVMGSASDRESWLARRSDSGEAGGSGSSSSKPDRAPRPVPCRGGCAELYCSEACESHAWGAYHRLICPAGGEIVGDPMQSAAYWMREFNEHADETNDIFRLAARVYAMVVASVVSKGGDAEADGSLLSLHLRSVRHAWKLPWWEQVALPHDVDDETEFRAQLKDLAKDSFDLLSGALRLRLPPSVEESGLLDGGFDLYGRLVGMFELNNLEIFHSAEAELGPVEGTAFYPLHSCMNHSCDPNVVMMFCDDDDEEGANGDPEAESYRCYAYATRDIGEGEEVTCSYLDQDQLQLSTEERQDLLRDYGFRCRCKRCGE